MDKLTLVIVVLGVSYCVGHPFNEIDKPYIESSLPGVRNGSKFGFVSIDDGSAITVKQNGDVLAEIWTGRPEQQWLAVTHPKDKDFFELKQEVVPYNMLSGFEDSVINPGLFPRLLSFADTYGRGEFWEIRIRTRWCLQANGFGWPLDIDDCEYFYAPWQLWKVIEIS